MSEQIDPEIKKRLTILQEATQPIPQDWWLDKPRNLGKKDNPPPEIEEGNTEARLFVNKEGLKEWEIRMCLEAAEATRPKDMKADSPLFLLMAFRVLTRVQARKIFNKYDLKERVKPDWEDGNDNNTKGGN